MPDDHEMLFQAKAINSEKRIPALEGIKQASPSKRKSYWRQRNKSSISDRRESLNDEEDELSRSFPDFK